MSRTKYLNITSIPFLLFWLSMIILAIHAPQYNNDYISHLDGNDKFGILGWCYRIGSWIDGRGWSLLTVIREIEIHYLPHNLVILIAVFYFFIFTTLIWLLIKPYINGNELQIRFFIAIIFFYGFHNAIAQIIFWSVGSFYIMSLCFLTFFVYLNDLNISENKLKLVVYVISGTAIAGSSQALLAPILLIFVFHYINKKENRLYLLAGFISFTINTILIFNAPGSRARMQRDINFSNVKVLLENFISTIHYYIQESVMISVYTILVFYLIKKSLPVREGGSIYSKSQNFITKGFLFLACSLSYAGTMSLVPNMASPRTAIFFQLFIFLTIMNFSLHYHYSRKTKVWSKIPRKSIITALLIIHTYVFYANYTYQNVAKANHDHLSKQILKIQSSKMKYGQIHEIYTISDKTAFCVNATDGCSITKDTNNWVNLQYYYYYGVKLTDPNAHGTTPNL